MGIDQKGGWKGEVWVRATEKRRRDERLRRKEEGFQARKKM